MESPLNIQVSSSVLPENFISSIHKKVLSKSPETMITINQMIMELQTTLSTKELIKIFIRHLSSFIDFDQYRFNNEKIEIFIENNSSAVHTCCYDLSLNQDHLGKITFSRIEPFDGWELENIENHLASLVFPLRNAKEHEKLRDLIEKNQELYEDSLIF